MPIVNLSEIEIHDLLEALEVQIDGCEDEIKEAQSFGDPETEKEARGLLSDLEDLDKKLRSAL